MANITIAHKVTITLETKDTNGHAKRILLVDDEDPLRELTEIALEGCGLNTLACASGRKALDALNVETFDLVLLDLRMPELSGIDVVRQMRSKGDLTRVVIFSAYIPSVSLVKALKYGVTAFLKKPACLETLRNTVSNALEKNWNREFASAMEKVEKLDFVGAAELALEDKSTYSDIAPILSELFIAVSEGRHENDLLHYAKYYEQVATIR